MADTGSLKVVQIQLKLSVHPFLKGLSVTMKKHPLSLKVEGELVEKVKRVAEQNLGKEEIIYEGTVRGLCPLAPNNVNTMACAALAGHNLGFDKVVARLVADTSLAAHVIVIEVVGPTSGEDTFRITTTRNNPAKVGAVTGNATYGSFLSSLVKANGQGEGFHFC